MNRFVFVLSLLVTLLAPEGLRAQKVQISTNAMGIMCLGTLNAEVNYAVSRHWSLGLSGKYNPFSFQRPFTEENVQMHLRQRTVAAVARWWPWHIYSGWWIAGKAQWQEYNMGGFLSEKTEEGQKWGGGITAGYSHMINKHLNVELGLGMWGGMKQYTVYACPTCGTRLDDGVKSFVLPNDLIIALSYVF